MSKFKQRAFAGSATRAAGLMEHFLTPSCLVPCDAISHRIWRLGAARDAMKQLHRLLEGSSCV